MTGLIDDGDDKPSKWASLKDRLAIVVAILVPFFFIFLMLVDTVRNGQCNPAQFFMFECNRFDTTFVPWNQKD